MSERVREILSWYATDNPGVKEKLYRLMNSGTLAGTGKLVILPVDQGFEHGPARSFQPNPAGYNPHYHFNLALEAGCSAYAAPLGALEAGAADFAGQIPLILKLNNSDSMFTSEDPIPAVTGSVGDALRLGASAIGFTIYPGSAHRNAMYEEIRELIEEAKACGLPTVIWSYARGSGLSSQAETAVDVISYGAQIACLLGAHIVKVKAPSEFIGLDANKAAYETIPIKTMTDRVKHVIQSAFGGRRIVIFSGGATNEDTGALLDSVKELAAGGAFGSIMGRNAFQRPQAEAVKLLKDVMQIFANA